MISLKFEVQQKKEKKNKTQLKKKCTSLTHGLMQGEYFRSETASKLQSFIVSSATLQSTCSNSCKFLIK